MPRVALLVTGEMERRGLAASLQRVFPEVDFHVEMKLDGFTTGRVRNLGATTTLQVVDKLAGALVAAVDPGRGGKPTDLAIAVEDLEVGNLDQPGVVVQTFRDAVARHVDARWPSQARRDRALATLRERASFHLLAPMPEAYFFAAATPLAATGVTRTPELAPGVDLEEFTVVDPGYLAPATGSAEWATQDRNRHPKRYLQYLLDPLLYTETQEGLAALGCIDWASLTIACPTHLRFLRSLLLDLAYGLGQEARIPAGPEHPATAFRPNLLRNA
jgi:hypothetical protein